MGFFPSVAALLFSEEFFPLALHFFPFLGGQPFAGVPFDFHIAHGVEGVRGHHSLHLLKHFHFVGGGTGGGHLEHWTNGFELFDQVADLDGLHAAASGDSVSAGWVDEFWVSPLLGRHGIDDAGQPAHFLFAVGISHEFRDFAHPGHQVHHLADQPGFSQFLHHVAEVAEGEDALGHPLFHRFAFPFIDEPVGFASNLDDIPHGQNSAGHAVGAKGFQRIHVLAGTDKFDGNAGDCLDAQEGSAAGVPVELGHDDPVQAQGFIEGFGAVDGVLARHAVDDEIDLIGLNLFVDLFELLHQFGIDGQATCGVQDDDIGVSRFGLDLAFAADRNGVGSPGFAEDLDPQLFAEDVELLDRSGALQVGGDEEGFELFLPDQKCQLAAGGRFSGPLQAAHHDGRQVAPFDRQVVVDGAEKVDELLENNLDELFMGPEGKQDPSSLGGGGHVRDELPHHVDADVRLDEGAFDQGDPLAHVGLGEFSLALERFEGRLESILERLEHGLGADGSPQFVWEKGANDVEKDQNP